MHPTRFLALAALLIAEAVPLPAAEPALSADDLARLDRGEVVTRLVEVPGEEHRAGLAARVLPHPQDRVLRAVADADHWAEWVPFLARSERQPPAEGENAAGWPRWELAFDLPFPLRDRRYDVRIGSAPDGAGGRTISWASVPGSGNVASARGSFTLSPRGPAGTLVVFRTATDPGDATSRFLLERALRESLAWVLDGLRQQVDRCRYSEPWPDGCREERPWTGTRSRMVPKPRRSKRGFTRAGSAPR
jgi:hypothetical protein